MSCKCKLDTHVSWIRWNCLSDELYPVGSRPTAVTLSDIVLSVLYNNPF